jgi:tRNA-Thr(GGU) m(6)t(6)A37 methyltransferase TsaA
MFEARPIGAVRSPLTDRREVPKQGTEGGAEAWLELDAEVVPGMTDIRPGDRLILLTWLHQADRDTLRVHPRDDPANPETGVFSTRSADRPNPVGLHEVTVLETGDGRLRVRDLEAVDGTPILDIKPVL